MLGIGKILGATVMGIVPLASGLAVYGHSRNKGKGLIISSLAGATTSLVLNVASMVAFASLTPEAMYSAASTKSVRGIGRISSANDFTANIYGQPVPTGIKQLF